MTNLVAIQNRSNVVQAAYRELRRRFLDPPRGTEDQRDLDVQLGKAEEALFDAPPPEVGLDGVLIPRAKGLITFDEVRAAADVDSLKALDELAVPKVPRIRDDFKLIPMKEWADIVQQKKRDEAFLRPLISHLVHDQNGNGSCASEGASGATETCEILQGNEDVELLNALPLYRLVNGGRDGGSSLSDNIAALQKHGCPSERVWPRSNGWRAEPSDAAKQDALRHRVDEMWRVSNKEEFGTALGLGMSVYAGYSGHAWFAVDLDANDPTGRFVWRNSWGKSWSDQGFSTLRYTSVAWYYGCWAFRTARRAAA